ncbi:MAG: histidine kinase [Desulfobacteraceae bacterium 4572_35.1]|nr:MAG: histidine kinase [Desulfobacteraceae bacterium 4572_35.1]
MFRNMSIRKRIVFMLATVYIVSLALVVAGGGYFLERDVVREAQQKTDLFATVMSNSARYLHNVIRPKAEELLTEDAYFPEGAVGVLMLTEVARYIQEDYPEYIFRFASPNSLNPDNLSDEFEDKIITAFDDGDFEDWKGFTERDGVKYYAVAKPLTAGSDCIHCHDTPDVAHPSQVEQYGTRSGYGYLEGDVVGARFIYVPTDVIQQEAYKRIAYFSAAFSIFFLLVLFAVDRFIVSSVVKPIEHIVEVSEDISRGKLDVEFNVKTNDEIKMLADAFDRMKVSLAKAMDILRQ